MQAVYKHHKRLPYPAYHTVGFIKSFRSFQSLVKDLCRNGIRMDHIDSLYGEEGLKMIEANRDTCIGFDRVIRAFQKFWGSGEWIFFRQADYELRRGRYLITVLTAKRESKERVAELMKKNGATFIKYFNPMYVEHISSDIYDGLDFQRSAIYE